MIFSASFLLNMKRVFGAVDSPSHAPIVHVFNVDSPCIYLVQLNSTFRSQFQPTSGATPSRARRLSLNCRGRARLAWPGLAWPVALPADVRDCAEMCSHAWTRNALTCLSIRGVGKVRWTIRKGIALPKGNSYVRYVSSRVCVRRPAQKFNFPRRPRTTFLAPLAAMRLATHPGATSE